MYLSNHAEERFLNAIRGTTFAAPSQLFCGLFLSSPSDTGTAGTEISYPGYARKQITFSSPSAEGSGIGVRNTSAITYAESNVDAGTVRHIGIFDSVTGGNLYLYGPLTEDLTVMAGESPVLLLNEVLFFGIGNLSTAYKTRLFNVMRGTAISGFTPYCALFNGNPQSGGNELTGNNYKRMPLAFSAPATEASGMSIIRNSARVEFPRPTAAWGNWSFTAVMSAATGGEPVFFQQRTTPKMLTKGVMPFLEVGDMTLGIN